MKTHRIKISATGRELVDDLCQAYALLAISEPGTSEADDAYAALQQRKVDTLQYIGTIERWEGVEQDVVTVDVPGGVR
jgi:hypothetical protein